MAAWLLVNHAFSSVTTKELREMFASYGGVERVLMFKGSTGKHVAFIEMAAEGDAIKAVQTVNEGCLLGEQSQAVLIQLSNRTC